jgi:hypothetical protein
MPYANPQDEPDADENWMIRTRESSEGLVGFGSGQVRIICPYCGLLDTLDMPEQSGVSGRDCGKCGRLWVISMWVDSFGRSILEVESLDD